MRVALASLALALGFWWPAFAQLHKTGFGDWQLIHHNWEVGFVSLTRYGEWPLWDPYHCGGVTMLGNPESQHLSPFFLLSLLVSTTIATKLMVLGHAWAGIAGMYLLARRQHGLSAPASWAAAVGWSCSGFFTWQIAGGHATFISFYLAPWLLLAWRRAAADLRWVAAVVAVMGLTILEGGTYPAPYFVLLLAFDSCVQLVRGKNRLGLVRAGLIAVPLTSLIAAIRLLPIAETLSRLPRTVSSQDHMRFAEIGPMLLRPHFPWEHPDHPYLWNEYACFMGWGFVIAAVVGAWLAVRRRRFEAIAGLMVFGAFMLGDRAWYWPWALIHELPVYDSLRVPSRFSVLFSFYLALIAGTAIDAVPGWLDRWRGRWPRLIRSLPWVAAAAITAAPFAYNHRTVNLWYNPPIQDDPAERFFLTRGDDYHVVYASLPRLNRGTPMCYWGNMNWGISKELWLGDHPQARIKGEGTVHDWGRTTNTAWASVTLPTQARVVFNQNFDPGWNTSVGSIVEDEGRLAVEMPAGSHRIDLYFHPESLDQGLAGTAAGLAATLALWGVGAWRRRRG